MMMMTGTGSPRRRQQHRQSSCCCCGSPRAVFLIIVVALFAISTREVGSAVAAISSSSHPASSGPPGRGGGDVPVHKVYCEYYDSNLEAGESGSINALFVSEGGAAENVNETDVDVAKKMMICGKESLFCFALWTTGSGSVPGDSESDSNESNVSSSSSSTTVSSTSSKPRLGLGVPPLATFLKQGCWEASPPSTSGGSSGSDIPKGSGYCQRPNCTSYYKKSEGIQPDQLNFCCCQGNYCNAHVSLEAIEDDEEEELDYRVKETDYHRETSMHHRTRESDRSMFYLVLVACLVAVLVLVLVATGKVWFVLRTKARKCGVDGLVVGADGELGDDPQEEDRLISNDLMNLKRFNKVTENDEDEFDLKLEVDSILDKEIANGRWGRIFSTKKSQTSSNQLFANKSLALKIYSPEHREFFENEKFVYECLGKESDNILKYYGWTENPTGGLVLAFELVDCNLREFLKAQTVSCQELVDILLGISRGVAYLHNGVSECSTAVAHRDLTSRNILIDLRTKHIYIADFGLSLLTRGSKYFWGGRERQAEFCSLAEAGTLRYMAPELLEGAVNLKDCENALKQADVYSLSLILWEVANSCGDLRIAMGENRSNDVPMSFHSLPFDEEAGNKETLSLDDVVRIVVQTRVRPGFHNWCDMGLTRALRETLNESWDSEPDARLTSLCIVERIQELKQNSLSNKFTTKSTKALEKKKIVVTEEPVWINRNPCLERNLLFDNASGSITDTNSVATMATNLSSGGSTTDNMNEHKFININNTMMGPSQHQQHQQQPHSSSLHSQQQQQQQPPPPPPPQPKAIQLIQNIRK